MSIEKKKAELLTHKEQMRLINNELSVIDQEIITLKTIKNSLEEIEKLEEGTEILSQIGGGLYIKTKLKKNDEILINVGSNIIVVKSVQEAREFIEKQIRELNDLLVRLEMELQRQAIKVKDLQEEIEKLKK